MKKADKNRPELKISERIAIREQQRQMRLMRDPANLPSYWKKQLPALA